MAEDPQVVIVEVTDTLSIDFTTGIQRVVREVVRGLQGPAGAGLEVLPVVQPRAGAPFRALTGAETERLAHHPAGGRAGRRADDFGRLAAVVRRVGDLPVTLRLRAAVSAARRRRREFLPEHRELTIDTFPPGAVFLDIEGSWYDPTPRAQLLPALAAQGVRPVAFVHDVMPMLFPQWFPPLHVKVFGDWLRAHLQHAEAFLANSEQTASDLQRVARAEGIDRELRVTVTPLGADLASDLATGLAIDGAATVRPPHGPDPSTLRYLLVVGTLEPRKNQATVLDAFDRLSERYPDLGLVLVGKEGWMVDDLVGAVRSHPLLGDRLFWLGGLEDAELAWLYSNAFLTVAPSQYEGLGVPVREALGRGCATIASNGGAQPEAGGDAVELFDPLDVDALVALLRRHLDDPDLHAQAVAAARAHVLPTWDDTAAAVTTALRGDSYTRRRPPETDHDDAPHQRAPHQRDSHRRSPDEPTPD